jgi:hypothetical protein
MIKNNIDKIVSKVKKLIKFLIKKTKPLQSTYKKYSESLVDCIKK